LIRSLDRASPSPSGLIPYSSGKSTEDVERELGFRRGVVVRPFVGRGSLSHRWIANGTAEENERCVAAVRAGLAR
jgi:histidinol-phosphate/aromatic aminotransferase/cobyric acid decarboxylase-like protein